MDRSLRPGAPMYFQYRIQEKWIRFLIHPFWKPGAIDFKKALKKASRILVVLPSSSSNRIYSKILKQIEGVFQGSHMVFIDPGSVPQTENQQLSHAILYLHMKRQTFRQLRKSHVLTNFSRETYDMLLDLDPDFSLVGFYIARLNRLSLTAGFSKPCSDRYYNIQYKGSAESTYEEKCLGLIRFLKAFTSR